MDIDKYLQLRNLPSQSVIEADLVASSMPLQLMNQGLPPSSHSLHIRSYLNLCSQCGILCTSGDHIIADASTLHAGPHTTAQRYMVYFRWTLSYQVHHLHRMMSVTVTVITITTTPSDSPLFTFTVTFTTRTLLPNTRRRFRLHVTQLQLLQDMIWHRMLGGVTKIKWYYHHHLHPDTPHTAHGIQHRT